VLLLLVFFFAFALFFLSIMYFRRLRRLKSCKNLVE